MTYSPKIGDRRILHEPNTRLPYVLQVFGYRNAASNPNFSRDQDWRNVRLSGENGRFLTLQDAEAALSPGPSHAVAYYRRHVAAPAPDLVGDFEKITPVERIDPRDIIDKAMESLGTYGTAYFRHGEFLSPEEVERRMGLAKAAQFSLKPGAVNRVVPRAWTQRGAYSLGELVRYNGMVYRATQDHTRSITSPHRGVGWELTPEL